MGLSQIIHEAKTRGLITAIEGSRIQAAANEDRDMLAALAGADASSLAKIAAKLGITKKRAKDEEEEDEDENAPSPDDDDPDDDDDDDEDGDGGVAPADDDDSPEEKKKKMKKTSTGNKALDKAMDYSQMDAGARADVEQNARMANMTPEAWLEKVRVSASRPGRGAEGLVGLPGRLKR